MKASTRTTGRAGQAGATRTDVILALGTLALLFAVAGVPGTTEGPARRLHRARQQVEQAVDLARALATSTGAPHGVAFDPEGERLAIIDRAGRLARDPLTGQDALVALSPAAGPRVDLVQAAFGAGGSTIILDPQGVPFAGGRLQLRCADAALSLALDEATGRLEEER